MSKQSKTDFYETTEVFKCGQYVSINTGAPFTVNGRITAISIRFGRVSYEITFYDGSDFKTVWMNEAEFNVNEKIPLKEIIGYKQLNINDTEKVQG